VCAGNNQYFCELDTAKRLLGHLATVGFSGVDLLMCVTILFLHHNKVELWWTRSRLAFLELVLKSTVHARLRSLISVCW